MSPPTDKGKQPSKSSLPSAGQVLRVLTGVQNVSATIFSVFFTVHLTSPIAAALGGGTLADKTLLIGRDLYLPIETLLIYAPLSLHLTASAIKRSLLTYRTKRIPQLTVHLLTGYLLIPLLLPHILTHRIVPQSPSPPISTLSPSELNSEFVSYSLFSRPIESTLAYLGIVGLAVPHAVLGGMKVVSWVKRLRKGEETAVVQESPRRTGIPKSRKMTAVVAFVGLMGVISIGLGRLYSEGGNVSGFMIKRYEAVFDQTRWTRLGLR